jgi:hypothetical protein
MSLRPRRFPDGYTNMSSSKTRLAVEFAKEVKHV